MIVVQAGSFMMGSPDKSRDIEGPVHRVNFAKPFAVGRFEVTVDQFSAFVNEAGDIDSNCSDDSQNQRTTLSWRNPGFPQTGTHPVTCISWDDAKAYTLWLTKKTGRPYRLMSESEWEYAARAGTTTYYSTGPTISNKQANFAATKRKGTVPVQSFQPNSWGLYQMHGNVMEWVEDCYAASYSMVPADGSAFIAGEGFVENACDNRVMRSGAWNYDARFISSTSRHIWGTLTDRKNTYGFRVARTLDQ